MSSWNYPSLLSHALGTTLELKEILYWNLLLRSKNTAQQHALKWKLNEIILLLTTISICIWPIRKILNGITTKGPELFNRKEKIRIPNRTRRQKNMATTAQTGIPPTQIPDRAQFAVPRCQDAAEIMHLP